jgi:hypothetical protein
LPVRRWSQCSAGKSKKAGSSASSRRSETTAFEYLVPWSASNRSMACWAADLVRSQRAAGWSSIL